MASPFQCQIGLRAQEVIASLAGRPGTDVITSAAVLGEAAAVLKLRPLSADRRRGAQLVGSLARAYVRGFRPSPEWELVGSEIELGSGRVDLLWRHRRARRLLIDELKAERGRDVGPDPEDLDQVERYHRDAILAFPRHEVTVRLIILGPPTRCHVFVRPDDFLAARTRRAGGFDHG
jgi:hypothetical protein